MWAGPDHSGLLLICIVVSATSTVASRCCLDLLPLFFTEIKTKTTKNGSPSKAGFGNSLNLGDLKSFLDLPFHVFRFLVCDAAAWGWKLWGRYNCVSSQKLLRVGGKVARTDLVLFPGTFIFFGGFRYFVIVYETWWWRWTPLFVSGTFMLLFFRISISSYLKELMSCLTLLLLFLFLSDPGLLVRSMCLVVSNKLSEWVRHLFKT